MGTRMDRGKVTDDQLDEQARRLIKRLNRMLYQEEVEAIEMLATGARLIEMRTNARRTHQIHQRRHALE